jgi:hypothetical protein
MGPPERQAAIDVFLYVYSLPRVPTPAALADWFERNPGRADPEWVARMCGRLRGWTQDKPYPLVPHDDELNECRMNPDLVRYWWVPGDLRGDQVRSAPRP